VTKQIVAIHSCVFLSLNVALRPSVRVEVNYETYAFCKTGEILIQLTPCIGVVLEVPQMFKKFPHFMEFHHRVHMNPPLLSIPSQIISFYAPPPNRFIYGIILIFSCYLYLGLPNDIFPSSFPTQTSLD